LKTLPLASGRAGKRLGRPWTGFFLVVLSLIVLPLVAWSAPMPVGIPVGTDPYSATVTVDATAANAVAARRLARLAGERRALTQVVGQIAGASVVQLPKLSDDAVTDMVKSFSVAHERMSAVRYTADYTFHFHPDKVRRLMRHVSFAAAPAPSPTSASPTAMPVAAAAGDIRRIVVLPVYEDEDGAQAVLWGEPNPWRDAWSGYTNGSAPVRLIVPLGGVGDLAAIDAQRAEAGQPDALAAIARRNGGDAVIVALATPQRNAGTLAGVAVRLKEYRGSQLIDSSTENVAAVPGEDQTALFRRAVAATAGAIEGEAAAAGSTEKASIAAVVPIASLGDWVAVRQRLATVPVIRKIALLSLNREEARVRLSYVGSPDQLKSALAAVDLALDGGPADWRLHPADAADSP
jgi:hypothetical protein